ncbi:MULTISPECIES: baseplate J/gp47 family protein [Pasteurellaceae]|uniref:Baseplate J/gp47 family protein n=1 Tax=Pasteurella atlantica TaxID=2827233 RepID=A0AAW8CJ86_9PAST|nr:baseplate J/gp47 family protein [Pasteurella atlantica]MBR0574064.1 baseplate J/gp47 family protein [Pasteurella atlantica]MDP8040113.1 baseplate J/gp47 family protein [Pasteurella atlantica]MDP8042226.1 baseplate J/gp47 family protein [Pasteurella atlantica]MDP8044367.1 baseplate J/gp47 family protein [Pasteurella atlantica]MDP8046385.1 baseplate J/gp47 family protein [Pasteurella atlantica]
MYIVPSLEEIRDQILRDLKSLCHNADTSVDSDNYARASALAATAEGIYSHQKWLVKQIFPDTADTDFLEKHASLRGLRRKNGTYAVGQALIKGEAGSEITTGLQIKSADGRFYTTKQSTVITTDGTVNVAVNSLEIGSSQNINTTTTGQFMSAPAGVSSEVVLSNINGGTDAETDAELLERLLEVIRRPAAGGNKYDYRRWAISVEGVTNAYVYPLRRGLGTVDIAITASNGLPSDDTVERCQNYIDDVRPVTAKESRVVKPDVTLVDFNITVKYVDSTLTKVTNSIKEALKTYFDSLIPGDDLIVSQCEAIVSDLVNVVDRRFTTPTLNRKADIINKIEWFRLGEVVVTEME